MPTDPTPEIVAHLESAEATLARAGRAVGTYLRHMAEITRKKLDDRDRGIYQSVVYEDLSKEIGATAGDLSYLSGVLAGLAGNIKRMSEGAWERAETDGLLQRERSVCSEVATEPDRRESDSTRGG